MEEKLMVKTYIGRAIVQRTRGFGEVLKELQIVLEQVPETPILGSQGLQLLVRRRAHGLALGSCARALVLVPLMVVAAFHGGPGHVSDLQNCLGHLYCAAASHGFRQTLDLWVSIREEGKPKRSLFEGLSEIWNLILLIIKLIEWLVLVKRIKHNKHGILWIMRLYVYFDSFPKCPCNNCILPHSSSTYISY